MKLNFNPVQGFVVPGKFYNLINNEIIKTDTQVSNAQAITLNFRDPSYSVDSGGYHPVEIRLEKNEQLWRLVYITDFAYSGGPYPELVKEIDVCFVSKQIFSLFAGWLKVKSSIELLNIFIDNFLTYCSMNVYQVSISID